MMKVELAGAVILNTNKYERKYNDIDSIGEMRL